MAALVGSSGSSSAQSSATHLLLHPWPKWSQCKQASYRQPCVWAKSYDVLMH